MAEYPTPDGWRGSSKPARVLALQDGRVTYKEDAEGVPDFETLREVGRNAREV